MICGNDPTAPMTPGDHEIVDWYRDWLTWAALPDAERLAVQAPVLPGDQATCAHCARPQSGYASVGVQPLCHPDEGMDCYRLVTVYGCTMPCRGGHRG